MADREAPTNRQTILESVGSGPARSGVATLTDPDAGETGARQTAEMFRDADQVRSMLSKFGGESLGQLSAEGHLPEASPDPFLEDGETPRDRVHVHVGESRKPITATRTFADRTVHLVVEPGNDRSFGVVDPDGGEPFVLDPDGGGTEGYCWWESKCADHCPDGDCPGAIFERECCDEGDEIHCTSWSRTSACCGGSCEY